MQSERRRGYALARQVFACQSGIGVAAGLIALAASGLPAAVAAFYGAMVAALPMVWMARRAFSAGPEATPQQIVGGFFRGEVGKMGLTAVLFFIGVALFARHFLPLILSYMAAQFAYGAVLMMNRD